MLKVYVLKINLCRKNYNSLKIANLNKLEINGIFIDMIKGINL